MEIELKDWNTWGSGKAHFKKRLIFELIIYRNGVVKSANKAQDADFLSIA